MTSEFADTLSTLADTLERLADLIDSKHTSNPELVKEAATYRAVAASCRRVTWLSRQMAEQYPGTTHTLRSYS